MSEIWVNNHRVTALFDTGLDYHCVVASHLVESHQYTDQTLTLQCATYNQKPIELRIAHIEIESPYVVGTIPAAVMDKPLHDVILGSKYVFLGIPKQPIRACPVTTRAQNKIDQEETEKFNPDSHQMKIAQQNDKSLQNCYKKLNRAHTPLKRGDFFIHDDLMYRYVNDDISQLVLPTDYRHQILETGHSIAFSGHTGMGATIQRITAHYYWPGVCEDIKRYVHSCPICQRKNTRTKLVPVILGDMPIIGVPFERIALDLIGPLTMTKRKNRFILTLIDCCTMWVEAIPLQRIDSSSIANSLINIFTRLGFPRQILSDNGSQLCGRLMTEVFQLLQTKHITTSVYHPQSNGQIERFNGTLLSILRKLVNDKPEEWDNYLAPALYAYREVPHTSTGISPATLLFGRPIAGPLSLYRTKTKQTKVRIKSVFFGS